MPRLDVLQETFLYVLKKIPGFRLTANFKTFLYPAVRNLSIAARAQSGAIPSQHRRSGRLEDIPAPPVQRAGRVATESRLRKTDARSFLLRFG